MSRPLSPAVRKIQKHAWVLLEEWDAPLTDYVIPQTFVSDGATVPRILWPILRPEGDMFEAGIVHDYLYMKTDMDRKQADIIFKNVGLVYGANPVRASLAYYAVRLFGGFFRK